MKIKISITDDKGETYVGDVHLRKADSDKDNTDIIISKEDNPMKTLASACGVTIEKLKKVVDYDDNDFIFTGNIDEPDFNKKRAKICQYLLTAWTKGKGIEWIDSSVLIESLRKLGMDTRNMNRSIYTKEGIFRTDGQKSGLKYALTIPGWKNGLKMLKAEAEKT